MGSSAARRAIRASIALAAVFGLIMVSPAAHAADPMATSNPAPVTGFVNVTATERSKDLWSAEIPSIGWITVGNDKCREITFAVTPLVEEGARKDLEVEFELWTPEGQEIASETLYGFSWNPTGGPTQVGLFDCDYAPGTYNLFVKTEYELSTNGLISRYLEGKQTLQFTIKDTPLCVKKAKRTAFEYVPADACPTGTEPVRIVCAKKGKPSSVYGFAAARCPKGYVKKA